MKITFDDEICRPWVKMPNNKYKTFIDKIIAIIEQDLNVEFDIHINKYVRYDPKHFGQIIKGAYIANIKIIDKNGMYNPYIYIYQLFIRRKQHIKTSIYKHLFIELCGLDYKTKDYYSISVYFNDACYVYEFESKDIVSCIIQLDMGNYKKTIINKC